MLINYNPKFVALKVHFAILNKASSDFLAASLATLERAGCVRVPAPSCQGHRETHATTSKLQGSWKNSALRLTQVIENLQYINCGRTFIYQLCALSNFLFMSPKFREWYIQVIGKHTFISPNVASILTNCTSCTWHLQFRF